MPVKYIGFMVFIYCVAIIFGSVTSGQDLFANANITDPVQATQIYGIQQYNTDFVTLTNPSFSPEWFVQFFNIITLKFPVFDTGPWVVLRWVILVPIIAIVVFGLVQLFSGLIQRNV